MTKKQLNESMLKLHQSLRNAKGQLILAEVQLRQLEGDLEVLIDATK